MKHPHAELMLEYAKDAMETDSPWQGWEYRESIHDSWSRLGYHPDWGPCRQYRRKPKPYEPTLLDQALELEIEACRLRHIDAENKRNFPNEFFTSKELGCLMSRRTPAMIEHLKSQGKL